MLPALLLMLPIPAADPAPKTRSSPPSSGATSTRSSAGTRTTPPGWATTTTTTGSTTSPRGPRRGRRTGEEGARRPAEADRLQEALAVRADRLRDLAAPPERTSSGSLENDRPFEDDPRVYNEYLTDSVYLLLTQSTLPQERNVAERRRPDRRTSRASSRRRRQSLKNPPKVFVETAIRQNRGAIAFYESGIFELAGETPPPASSPAPAAQGAWRR